MKNVVIVLVLLVILAYGQTANYPFVYDDLSGILDNHLIAGAGTIAQAARVLLEPSRSVTNFSYAIMHVFFGFSKPAYHAANVVIHLLNTILVFGIAMKLARRWLPKVDPVHFGLAAGAIHAVHALYTEAVTYVSGRSSSLCALFYFGCLFLVMQAVETSDSVARRLWFCAAAASGALAWAAKEEAITLPLIVAVLLMLNGYKRSALGLMALPSVVLVANSQTIAQVYRESAANESLVQLRLGAAWNLCLTY